MIGLLIKSSFAVGMIYIASSTVMAARDMAYTVSSPVAASQTAQIEQFRAGMN